VPARAGVPPFSPPNDAVALERGRGLRQVRGRSESMRTFIVAIVVAVTSTLASRIRAAEPAAAPATTAKAQRCEHGVKKTTCTRCNPKLIPVFKAKGDWCEEHGVPESQCAKCNPKLAKEGVK